MLIENGRIDLEKKDKEVIVYMLILLVSLAGIGYYLSTPSFWGECEYYIVILGEKVKVDEETWQKEHSLHNTTDTIIMF